MQPPPETKSLFRQAYGAQALSQPALLPRRPCYTLLAPRHSFPTPALAEPAGGQASLHFLHATLSSSLFVFSPQLFALNFSLSAPLSAQYSTLNLKRTAFSRRTPRLLNSQP